jgi:GT2 family glycosyltransferase
VESVPDESVVEPDARVLALVLTFDAPEALRGCLEAISAQDCRPDILVIDNASPDPVTDIVARFPGARIQRLHDNVGPAGGHAAGLRAFLDGDAEYAWVMDDDCQPDPRGLRAQLALARSRLQPAVVMPTVVDADTRESYKGYGWSGVLLPRAVVGAVGVPNEDLFWWSEDTEYLQWRIPNAGFDVCWSSASTIEVNRRYPHADKPPWKYYYEVRNQVYYRLYVQRAGDRRPIPRHLRLHVRAWRASRAVTKLALRVVVREHDQRAKKLVMVARGTADGLRGRLGHSVLPDRSDRPAPIH